MISRGNKFSFVDIRLDYYPGIQQGGGSCLLGGNPLRKLLHQAQAAGDTPLSLVEPARQIIHQQSPDDKENGETLAVDGDGERTVRKSTRTAVIVKQAEREALRVALQATPRVETKTSSCVQFCTSTSDSLFHLL